jgi:hypothetical protein
VYEWPQQLREDLALRKFLLSFGCDVMKEQSITELIPLSCLDILDRFTTDAVHTYEQLSSILLRLACQTLLRIVDIVALRPVDCPVRVPLLHLLTFLCTRCKEVSALFAKCPPAIPATQPEPYAPVHQLGAYNFTSSGERLRRVPGYVADREKEPTECTKRNPSSATESNLFFVFDPMHGFCWGMPCCFF